MTEELRIRILAESPVHGPILLAELDGLWEAATNFALAYGFAALSAALAVGGNKC